MSELHIKNLNFSYSDKAILKDVNIDVGNGEVVAFLGPSGCGKSTLLKLISGIEKLQEGEVLIGGQSFSMQDPAKRGVFMVFQNPALFPHMNVTENVLFAMKKSDEKRAIEMLAMVDMKEYKDCYPHTLSGGQQQRVSIARAVANYPKILLLDEPFASLDVMLRKKVREDCLEFLRLMGITTVLVTHDPDEAFRLADRIYVIEQGRVVQVGKAKELYEKPKDIFVSRLFGELNQIDGKSVNGKFECLFGSYDVACKDGNIFGYFRPEDIFLSNDINKGVKAVVEKISFMGIASLVYLRIEEGGMKLRARVVSNCLPNIGQSVYVSVEKITVFEK